jgi:hypothetical protein
VHTMGSLADSISSTTLSERTRLLFSRRYDTTWRGGECPLLLLCGVSSLSWSPDGMSNEDDGDGDSSLCAVESSGMED